MPTDFLFDLDGTLTDPAAGITNSVANALEKMGYPVPSRDKLECFIGPPLNEAFTEFYGFTPAQNDEAIILFREYFTHKGIWENEIYPGIPQMLRTLKEKGHRLFVATSKPEVFATRILDYFDISAYFTVVAGSPLDGHGSPKADVVRDVLCRGDIQPQNAIMVGDRKHDIIGAHANDVRAVGVTYGFGGLPELQQAGADYICGSIQQLTELLQSL